MNVTSALTTSLGSSSMSPIASTTDFVPCVDDPTFVTFVAVHKQMARVLIAVSVIGSVFNLIVVRIAIHQYRKTSDVVHLFIISMSASDFVTSGLAFPLDALFQEGYIIIEELHEKLICRLLHYLSWSGLACSAISLTLLNFDKLLYFQWPLRYDSLATKTRASVSIVTCCTVINGIMLLFWFGADEHTGVLISARCEVDAILTGLYETTCVIFVLFPVLSSGLLSVYLFKLTRNLRHNDAVRQLHPLNFKQNLRSLLFIFVTTAWTTLTLTPFRIFNLFKIHFIGLRMMGLECETRNQLYVASWLLFYLVSLSPVVNPLITLTIYAPYRLALTGSSACHGGRTRSPSGSGDAANRTTNTTTGGAANKPIPATELELMPLRDEPNHSSTTTV